MQILKLHDIRMTKLGEKVDLSKRSLGIGLVSEGIINLFQSTQTAITFFDRFPNVPIGSFS